MLVGKDHMLLGKDHAGGEESCVGGKYHHGGKGSCGLWKMQTHNFHTKISFFAQNGSPCVRSQHKLQQTI